VNYEELAAFVAAIPRLPRYTLHAHPLVIELLSQTMGPSKEYTVLDEIQAASLTGMDIFAEPDWPAGRYEMRKDGKVIHEGTSQPSLANLKETE
jgi:hypothetical protein